MAQIEAERLGIPPDEREGDGRSVGNGACPDIIDVQDPRELDLAGNPDMRMGSIYLVIGTIVTREQLAMIDLPVGAAVAEYEGVVAIPESVLASAALALAAKREAVSVNDIER